ncbi:hypothetical protein F5Y14DRAFT_410812 [Nemania sp. NC0429]|nr:hypothetical protein F5Y14DRAFT_410812 [Nemania sp. NC0429]
MVSLLWVLSSAGGRLGCFQMTLPIFFAALDTYRSGTLLLMIPRCYVWYLLYVCRYHAWEMTNSSTPTAVRLATGVGYGSCCLAWST